MVIRGWVLSSTRAVKLSPLWSRVVARVVALVEALLEHLSVEALSVEALSVEAVWGNAYPFPHLKMQYSLYSHNVKT